MSTSGKVVCGKNCAAEYPSKKRIQSMGRSESGRTQRSQLSAAGHRVGTSIGRTRGQPRLQFSVALTECAPWVLNCQCACFVFVDTTLAKLRSEEHTSELQSLRHLV